MARKPTGKPTGRPIIEIDWKIFEQLCHMHCTQSEIAGWFHCSPDTIERRVEEKYRESFAEIYKKFSEGGKCSLRRKQWHLAEKNAAMAIWLGKNNLGQRDFNEPMSQTINIQPIQRPYDDKNTNVNVTYPT